jgi:hypothetical protein
MTVSRELSRYRLYLVGTQEVRWEGSGTVPAREYTFFYGKRGMRTMNWVQGFFVHKRIISALKRVVFVSDRMSYIHVILLSLMIMPQQTIKLMK